MSQGFFSNSARSRVIHSFAFVKNFNITDFSERPGDSVTYTLKLPKNLFNFFRKVNAVPKQSKP